ncbi:FAD-binding oxidoreductase [uncultured Halopseudomonas sp.]|uniref:NAD(P)/FAD-dependent oxidoreductase n=1 Tax=uncultured Halopseudomonas sp. TaxID=2901193 RepID=UPI0030ED9ED6|tara:strand:- start:65044 stop:66345 length:1302 start_codon:yes stop_codon:yes gene_type:complete
MLAHSPQLTPAPSWYRATTNVDLTCPPLAGAVEADVCIVGGGYTGINTAIELAERGLSVVLLEASHIGWGASGRNGGQLIRGVGHGLEQFTNTIGEEGVRDLKLMGLEAVQLVKRRVEQYAIDCNLVWGYCDLANKARHMDDFQAEKEELQDLGYEHEMRLIAREDIGQVVNSDFYLGGMTDMGSGHLHPLNLLLGEAAAAQRLGVQLCENSRVVRIEHGPRVKVHTANGSVSAGQLVLAGNAYLGDLQPQLSGKVLPAGSYVIATEPLGEELARSLIPQNMALCDQRVALDYYRLSADNRLIFGGACHYSGRDPKDIAGYMRPKMLRVFPQLANTRVEFQWGGMIGIGANRLPQVGKLADHPNVFYAQAYAGHGINCTHLAAKLLGEAVSGQASRGFELFDRIPHMTFPGGKHLRAPLLALGMAWEQMKEVF